MKGTLIRGIILIVTGLILNIPQSAEAINWPRNTPVQGEKKFSNEVLKKVVNHLKEIPELHRQWWIAKHMGLVREKIEDEENMGKSIHRLFQASTITATGKYVDFNIIEHTSFVGEDGLVHTMLSKKDDPSISMLDDKKLVGSIDLEPDQKIDDRESVSIDEVINAFGQRKVFAPFVNEVKLLLQANAKFYMNSISRDDRDAFLAKEGHFFYVPEKGTKASYSRIKHTTQSKIDIFVELPKEEYLCYTDSNGSKASYGGRSTHTREFIRRALTRDTTDLSSISSISSMTILRVEMVILCSYLLGSKNILALFPREVKKIANGTSQARSALQKSKSSSNNKYYSN